MGRAPPGKCWRLFIILTAPGDGRLWGGILDTAISTGEAGILLVEPSPPAEIAGRQAWHCELLGGCGGLEWVGFGAVRGLYLAGAFSKRAEQPCKMHETRH